MNDKFTTNTERDDDVIARKLTQIAAETQPNQQFSAELEERLRASHRPGTGWWMTFSQISPALRWVAVMVLLALVLSWSIRSLIPAPQPAVDETPVVTEFPTTTPEPNVLPEPSATPGTPNTGYDFRGAKLFLEEPLPESPATAHVYMMDRQDRPATLEQAQALAARFGIQGETYTTSGLVYGTNDYLISDGKQSIQVHSETYFSYSSDMARSRRAYPKPDNPNAETIIRDFLTARGFNFPFRVYPSFSSNGYVVQPLAPDNIPMQYESFSMPMMRVVLDENGEVLTLDASLMVYDQTALGEYGIITAEEALGLLLDEKVFTGKVEFVHSSGNLPQEWYREYPDNQPVNLYGYLTIDTALDPGKQPLLLINGIPLVGNTAGMEGLQYYAYVKATGQFFRENGVRKFNVETWDHKVQEQYLTGVLTRQGDQIMFTSNDGRELQYPLLNPPVDVPLDADQPGTQLAISGVIVDGQIDWTYIQYFESNQGGGGGGGGGVGFYKLNLSGTPVVFPTATSRPENADPSKPNGSYIVQEGDTLGALAQRFGTSIATLSELNDLTDGIIFVGQNLVVPFPAGTERRVENMRGYLSITDHKRADGTTTREYGLQVAQEMGVSLYPLQGSILNELDAYNALPIEITGTINPEGILIAESYNIPYPNVQFQILKGTQKMEQVEGQEVVIFTAEDGSAYVEFLATNTFPSETFSGFIGDPVEQEVLIIPGETFGPYPVAHIYQSAIVQEGAPEMQVQANQIYVFDESEMPDIDPGTPNLTITSVELVYFGSNPYYQMADPNYEQRPPHIQPVWHFVGRYDDGTEFDVLIQAIKQEFLLPELAPGVGPG